jgi:predicted dehydrogenase
MEHTLLCLDQGKAVLCEKPLAVNSYQVRKMIDSSRENKAFLMEAVWSRFLPNIIKAKQLVDSGTIGSTTHLEADFGFKARYDPGSRLFAPELGGGALLDIGIYPLFLAQYLFGRPESIEADATLAATGVDESCQVRLGYDNGRTAHLSFTLTADTQVEARISGSDGQILLPNRWYQPVNVTTIKDGKPRETVIDFVGNGYNYQAVEVQKCLEQGTIESKNWSHQDSLMLMQTMDEIRKLCGIEYPADKIRDRTDD